MGGADKIWLVIGLGSIVLPALAYGCYLHHAAIRDMFRGDIEDADTTGNAAGRRTKALRGEP